MDKECPVCHQKKNLEQFNYKSSSPDLRQPYCRECSKEDFLNRYPPEWRAERNRLHRTIIREYLDHYLNEGHCEVCEALSPLVLYPSRPISNAVSRKYSLNRLEGLVLASHVLCSPCAEKAKQLEEV